MDKYEYFWMCIRNNFLPGDISRGTYIYEEILKMNEEELVKKIGLTSKQASYIMSTRQTLDIDREYEHFLASGAKAVTLHDEEYPERLKYIDNMPYALFYYGDLPDEKNHSVAIIGTRKNSEYGKFMAESIAADLADKNISIISGMAYGIDGISQTAALKTGGKSYGVIGSGVDVCYPRANKLLYERLKREGGVISEYPIGRGAVADNFPYRNRIISGLSDIVIVVEAKLKSGTFITVDYALSQGKEIMIVPGRATDPMSLGCNALLSQGAHVVQSADDVIRLLDSFSVGDYIGKNVSNPFRTKELSSLVPKPSEKILLDREENMVYSVLDFYALGPEDIARSVNLDIFQIMNILIGLELKGLIRETDKNLYVRCR